MDYSARPDSFLWSSQQKYQLQSTVYAASLHRYKTHEAARFFPVTMHTFCILRPIISVFMNPFSDSYTPGQ